MYAFFSGHIKYGLHKMKDEPSKDIRVRKMESYFVMLNVRHPLERLESAYRDKFSKPTVYSQRFIQSQQRDPLRRDLQEAQDDQVSFTEFLDMVIEENWHDMHWRPYLQLHVCNMHAE